MGRIATGATLATFVLTGAAIAAASGCPPLMWALIGASLVMLLATIANRLPGLNVLPLVGAPRPVVTLKVNGSPNLVVRLARPDPSRVEEARTTLKAVGADDAEPRGCPEPRAAQIEVGVSNPSSFERIDQALINFLLPVGLRRRKTDASGNRMELGGNWLVTRDRVAGGVGAFDYWSQDDVDYAAGSSALMWFEATFTEPGDYPIRMRISAPAQYEKDYDTDAVIRVEVAEDGAVEQVTDVIEQGVEVKRRLRDGGQEAAIMSFSLQARLTVMAMYAEGLEMLNAATAYEGPRAGPDYYEAIVNEDLAALYTIRRMLGEAEHQRSE